jgi:hypothetical protein
MNTNIVYRYKLALSLVATTGHLLQPASGTKKVTTYGTTKRSQAVTFLFASPAVFAIHHTGALETCASYCIRNAERFYQQNRETTFPAICKAA